MNGTTTSEAANHLGVPKSTLHTWLQQLPIPHDTDSRGRKSFDADALAVLEAVKNLRGEDCGYQTIRRKLEGVNEPERDATGRLPEACETERDAYETAPHAPVQLDTAAIVEAVTEAVMAAVRGDNEIARMYGAMGDQVAKAAHTIGTLEERVSSLTTQLGEARALLTAGDDVRADRDRLAGELAAARALLAAPVRPWWKLWG